MLSKLQRGECNDFWKEIKALNQRRNPCHIQWEELLSGRVIANSVGSTDQVMNAMGTVPGHSEVINVHELRKIVSGLKNKVDGNDGILYEVYKFESERLLTMMSIFLSVCMLTGNLPNTYPRSDHTATEVQI